MYAEWEMYFNRQKFNNYSGLLNTTTARVWTYSLGEAILSFNICICNEEEKKDNSNFNALKGDIRTQKNIH